MAVQHPHETAARIAGDLYGKILNRMADPDGYKYTLESLREGRKSVRELALEMIGSEEFGLRLADRDNPVQGARVLNKLLFGRVPDERLLPREAALYKTMGRAAYAEQLTRSWDYQRLFGDDRLPMYGH